MYNLSITTKHLHSLLKSLFIIDSLFILMCLTVYFLTIHLNISINPCSCLKVYLTLFKTLIWKKSARSWQGPLRVANDVLEGIHTQRLGVVLWRRKSTWKWSVKFKVHFNIHNSLVSREERDYGKVKFIQVCDQYISFKLYLRTYTFSLPLCTF